MAPLQPSSSRSISSTSRLEIPTMADHTSSSSSTLAPIYTSVTSTSKSDLNTNPELDFDLDLTESPISPRALYAQSFERPGSSQSLPSTRRFRKNMKEMTGFGTTEEEFEALPIAVRKKVRVFQPLSSSVLCLCRTHHNVILRALSPSEVWMCCWLSWTESISSTRIGNIQIQQYRRVISRRKRHSGKGFQEPSSRFGSA